MKTSWAAKHVRSLNSTPSPEQLRTTSLPELRNTFEMGMHQVVRLKKVQAVRDQISALRSTFDKDDDPEAHILMNVLDGMLDLIVGER